MKVILTLLCLVAVSYGQPTRGPTRLDPGTNENSTCGDATRMCPDDVRCIERRDGEDSVINECDARLADGEGCPPRNFFRGAVEGEDLVDDDRFSPARFERERAVGASDRDLARRIHGSLQNRQCEDVLNCMDNTCMMREATMCDTQARSNDQVRCEEDGRFQLLQCRRPRQLTARSCFCVNQTNGDMVPDTMRTVMSREDLPDCTAALRCTFQRALRTALLRDGEASARAVDGGPCMNCRCEDGEFTCRMPAGVNAICSRYDTGGGVPSMCMINGEEVPHAQRLEDGKCNVCGCRNNFARCTRVRDCRGEDGDAGRDSDRNTEDMRCDECMDMPNGPVCAVRDGRTFPTRCHAMRCKGFEMDELRDGPCSEWNACSSEDEQPCGVNSSSVCMRRGGSTLMSREASLPNDRRICVNRQELRCRLTITMSDGRRRIMSDAEDSAEVGEDVGDDDKNDETVCASDGNTYPSTCHMVAESRGDMVPRVMHSGMCRPMLQERMVCATDGVTYADEQTMRTTGGNVRMDFMGRCDDPDSDEDDTPAQRCMKARENRCPSLEGCTRRVNTEDGCCSVCGSIVVFAMDQQGLDQHTSTTRDLREVDEYMGRYFRPGNGDAAISDMAARRCNISMTLPATTAGNDVEILFQARDTRNDGDYCHEQAILMVANVKTVSDPGVFVLNEVTFVAALIVAPEAVVDAAPAFAASCAMLLGAFLVAFLL